MIVKGDNPRRFVCFRFRRRTGGRSRITKIIEGNALATSTPTPITVIVCQGDRPHLHHCRPPLRQRHAFHTPVAITEIGHFHSVNPNFVVANIDGAGHGDESIIQYALIQRRKGQLHTTPEHSKICNRHVVSCISDRQRNTVRAWRQREFLRPKPPVPFHNAGDLIGGFFGNDLRVDAGGRIADPTAHGEMRSADPRLRLRPI
ncbi:MAG: hypothetical protein BWX80_03993 [Candidatus Hydrogenedentes bacterium ADurb.Bin101]|nr:MAG: hypothetical protein BWX80_03993 [Candidatus Hydrogenedentes bacterium ADurb.Bin101]